MPAIVSSPSILGRISPYVNLSGLSLTINGNGATYVQGAGNGLPFDLAAFLSTSLVNDMPYLNPGDVLALFIPSISSTGDYLTGLLTLGTPTYTAVSGSGYGSQSGLPAPMSVQPDNTLTTFPCNIRLFNGTTEFAAGACSEIFTIMLFVVRGGVNA
jgi:hypothetical protein